MKTEDIPQNISDYWVVLHHNDLIAVLPERRNKETDLETLQNYVIQVFGKEWVDEHSGYIRYKKIKI